MIAALTLTALSMIAQPVPATGIADPVAPHSQPMIPPATIDDALEITGTSIDARQIQTRMTVGVLVNGQGPFRFLVDSGADRSVVGTALAKRLALAPGRSVTLHDMAGTTQVGTVRLERLKLGGSEIRDRLVPALPEAFLGAQGLVGIDALAGQRLMFDFDDKTITVQDTRQRAPSKPAGAEEIVVTARRRKGQLILTEASVSGRGIYAVVDSGAQVTIGNAALRAAVFRSRRAAAAATKMTLVSVTGQEIVADMVVLPELKIGGLTLQNVAIAFADVPPFALFGLADRPAILLGTDVLEIFRRVTLDFRNRKIRFLLRPRDRGWRRGRG